MIAVRRSKDITATGLTVSATAANRTAILLSGHNPRSLPIWAACLAGWDDL